MSNHRRKMLGGVAAVAAVALLASACGSSSKTPSSTNSSGGSSATGYNAALNNIVNPSTAKGGTMVLENRSAYDSPDMGNTYAAFSWDNMNFYARSLLSYAPAAGTAGEKLVGDLATGPGTVSADGLTWTYTLRQGLKYADGTPITSADVKYAVERSNWGQDTLVNGPSYFKTFVEDKTSYKGPYLDKNPNDGVSGITTPDANTIVFKLSKPFADFDYLAALSDTAPVPRAKDDGTNYATHILASGQYEITKYTPSVELDLAPNPNWDPSTDPNHLHPVLASNIVLKLKEDPTQLDNDLLNGNAAIDDTGVGVQAPTQTKILTTPSLKADADVSHDNSEFYLAIDQQVKPFDNLDCRKAVELAINKVSVQTALGGPIGGGDIATTAIPETIPGYVKTDAYPTPGEKGDPTGAKAELAKCAAAEPSEFTNGRTKTAMAFRNNSPKEQAATTSMVSDLANVGIDVTPNSYDFGAYNSQFAGNTAYVAQHDLGLQIYKWGPDFLTAYGYLFFIFDASGISASGSGTTNLSRLNDPVVEQLFNKANDPTQAPTQAARNAIYAQMDQEIMAQAAIVPLIYDTSLLYRPPGTTNVTFSQPYGMYNFSIMGPKPTS